VGLRQLRLEAQEKARQIIPALFVEMFGDPAANPKGWPRVPFGDLVTIKAQLRKPDIRAEGHFACFGPEAIESRTGRLLAYGTVSECRPKSGKYLFSENEVLYSKIRPYLAKAAIVTDKGYCSADMYPLSCMKIVVPEFVLKHSNRASSYRNYTCQLLAILAPVTQNSLGSEPPQGWRLRDKQRCMGAIAPARSAQPTLPPRTTRT
jgi:type I restriction enzyme S subunit